MEIGKETCSIIRAWRDIWLGSLLWYFVRSFKSHSFFF